MCKILVLTNTEKLKNQTDVIESIAGHLQKDHTDGFGYAIQGENGVYGERTIADAFSSRLESKSKLEVTLPIIVPEYNKIGAMPSKPIGGALFHGRTSTNDHGLPNTHPIQKHGWTLIHNGVVNNHGPTYEQVTTNDTEHLIEYLGTVGMQGIEQNITGYYAIGALDNVGNLHVIKDSTAQLCVAHNETLACLVFGTTEKLIKDVAKSCKWTIGPVEKVRDDIHMIFDKSGVLISVNEINPRGFGREESRLADRSLGFKVYATDDFSKEDLEYYNEWKNETDFVDAGYTFRDWNGRPMDYKEFMACDEVTKLDCTVIRPDGTIVDAEDYFAERLA